jgi:hypothetical protein
MDARLLFPVSVLMSLVAFGLVTALYIWPRLKGMATPDALKALVVAHTYRFAGLSFLIPGVASASVPQGFAHEAAYGDLVAAILAVIATLSLASRARWAMPMVWIFNIWGAADLLNAMYLGPTQLLGPGVGVLGATYFIPTLFVPALLITHGLIFRLLLRRR